MGSFYQSDEDQGNGEHRGPLYYGADLIKAGYPTFPVDPDRKNPSVDGGFYAATFDPQQIGAWIMEGKENHNVAIATGLPSGVVVIDADSPEQAERMRADHGPPQVETRRGAHWFFKHPGDGRVVSRSIEDSLDCKADGGYVVAPPSPGRSWTDGIPDKSNLPPFPTGFRKKTRTGGSGEGTGFSPRGEGRLDKFVRLQASALVARRVAELKNGQSHAHLMACCGSLLRHGVSPDDVRDIMYHAWVMVGGELRDRAEREVPNTLRTTMANLSDDSPATGVPKLEELTPSLFSDLQDLLRGPGSNGSGEDPPAGNMGDSDAPEEDSESQSRKKKDRLTEPELFEEWAGSHDEVKFSGGEARRYSRGVWPIIEEGRIGLELWGVIDRVGARNTPGRTVRSVVDQIKSRGHRDSDAWDPEPYLLVVKNGTLEFGGETPVLREHRREDYARFGLPIEYDPDAQIDLWRRVLDRLDPESQLLLQQFVGYSLTPDVSEAKTVWLHGEPGGGKSTFIDTVAKLFGERAGHFSLDDLSSPFGLASIPGRTLLTSTEQPRAYIPQSHTLAAIISGEKITVNQKNVKAYQHKSTAKILWAMNSLPTVAGANSGLFRRVLPIAWPELDPSERNKNLMGNLEKELPAILNWAVEGLRLYREAGTLTVPQSILDAQEEFKADNDTTLQFVEEEMIEGDPATTYQTTASIHSAYVRWCEDAGYKPKARKQFIRELASKRDWEAKQTSRDGNRDSYLLGGMLRRMAGRV